MYEYAFKTILFVILVFTPPFYSLLINSDFITLVIEQEMEWFTKNTFFPCNKNVLYAFGITFIFVLLFILRLMFV